MCEGAGKLSEAQVERLRSLFPRTHIELYALALAQIFEIDLGREPRAMEEYLVAAVVGRDEAEALIFNHFLDRARHFSFSLAYASLDFCKIRLGLRCAPLRRLREGRCAAASRFSRRDVPKVEVTSRAPYVKE